jgi:hypothetical protein
MMNLHIDNLLLKERKKEKLNNEQPMHKTTHLQAHTSQTPKNKRA